MSPGQSDPIWSNLMQCPGRRQNGFRFRRCQFDKAHFRRFAMSTIAADCHNGVKIYLSRGYIEVLEHGVHCIPKVDEITFFTCAPLDTVTDSPLDAEPSEVGAAPVFTDSDPARLSKNRTIRCQDGMDNGKEPNQQADEDNSNEDGYFSGEELLKR